ncbi:MAG: hypothetical protein KDA87_16755 [Planctomycetales bacterium]|nr:hypothetical protein [Planctomycetales bacterium]
MNRLRILACIVCLTVTKIANAGTPFFWDDFDRVTREDLVLKPDPSGNRWTLGVNLAEEAWIESGSLFFRPLSNDLASVFADTPALDSFVVRGSIRFPQNATLSSPYVSLSFSQDNSVFDWGGKNSAGDMHIGTFTNESGTRSTLLCSSCLPTTSDETVEYLIEAAPEIFTLTISNEDGDTRSGTRSRAAIVADAFGFTMNPNGMSPNVAIVEVLDFAVLPYLTGDYNASDVLDAEDIDLLAEAMRSDAANRVFDLNDDAVVTSVDHSILVKDIFGTYFGDTNLDGEFNSADFVPAFQASEYEDTIVGNSRWSTGDWNGDGEFDSNDFVVAFQDRGYEQGPRPKAVPEPSGVPVVIAFVFAKLLVRRRSLPYSKVGPLMRFSKNVRSSCDFHPS